MKTILITGGSGFIGSHTCLVFLREGYKVYVIDSFKNSSPESLKKTILILKKEGIYCEKNIHLFNYDVRNEKKIEEIFLKAVKNNSPIEAVIHFAGLKSVSESKLDPLSYWENNVVGTISLLNIMKKFNCNTFVFSSSASVYKSNSDINLKETDICEPINPYGKTKLTIENILSDVYKSAPSQWKIISLRYFNPVGAHQSGLIGENPLDNLNNIFPQITKVALGKQDKIKIFGSDWPTFDGTGIRDYIHVMDLAEGHLNAFHYITKQNPQIIRINIGTGSGHSVLQLIKTFERTNNVKIPFSFEDRRQGDNAIVVADNSLAKKLLKWQPTRNLIDMCRDGWNWQKKNPNGF